MEGFMTFMFMRDCAHEIVNKNSHAWLVPWSRYTIWLVVYWNLDMNKKWSCKYFHCSHMYSNDLMKFIYLSKTIYNSKHFKNNVSKISELLVAQIYLFANLFLMFSLPLVFLVGYGKKPDVASSFERLE